MSLLLANWKLLGIALILAALGGYTITITEERNIARSHLAEALATITSIKAQSEAIQAKAIARNKAIERQNEQTNQELANDYAKTVAAINDRGNSGITCRMFKPAGGGVNSLPTKTYPSERIDAAPSDALVARLPQDAAITTAMLVGLQKFVREECTK